jgi:hypothetical protein
MKNSYCLLVIIVFVTAAFSQECPVRKPRRMMKCLSEVAKMGPGIVGYVPQCDEHFGNYQPLQIAGHLGSSWCVDRFGNELDGTAAKTGVPHPLCPPIAPSRCQVETYMEKDAGRNESIPFCDENGEYEPLQVDVMTGEKWCVDRDGNELNGTCFPPGEHGPDCPPIVPKTECLKMADAAELLNAVNLTIPGIFAASCDKKGGYSPLQADGRTGEKWCVRRNGTELPGTRIKKGDNSNPDCSRSRMTKCLREVAKHGMMVGYVPQCEEYFGNYQPLQFSGSSGYSWCVDRSGNEYSGTSTPPGFPNPHCPPIAPGRCQVETYIQKAAGRNELIPRCDEIGEYEPLQNDAVTGEKRCVDRDGKESKEPDPYCAKIVPKTECLKMTDAAKLLNAANLTIPGIFTASCDNTGGYNPLQADEITGEKWCVHKNGTELSGTRAKTGDPKPDC